MSMLQRNNDQLVKMLMAMFREPRPTEDYDPYDSDASPIGEPLGPPNTVRLMPVEALQNFDGDRENKDAAAMWLQRFEETAVACGWSDKEVLQRFRLHSDKPVHDWLFQIDSIHLTTWARLRARFVKEFVKSPIPKTEVYYNMTQGPSEHIKAYFVRFNAAALRIRLDYRKSRDFLEEHIDRFARTLKNRALAQAINTQQFRTIGELEEYLDKQQQKEAIDRFQSRTKLAQPGASPAPLPVSDRGKTRKPSVQFMESNEMMDGSLERRYLPSGDTMELPSVSSVMNVVVSTSQSMVNVGLTSTAPSATRWVTQRPTVSKPVLSVPRHTINTKDAKSGKGWLR
ncbi:hypothetical protein LEN26_016496 [Aphanomyces euteiches]|nr:hypothetical protein LEN26_016496 [Aphanomyces euteiches]